MNLPTSILFSSCQLAVATLSCCFSTMHAQTFFDDSRIDDRTRDLKGPFNYFLTPSDAIGFMDSPKAFQLTGDGAYSSFWGELTVWAGTPL